jgi:cytochrome c-type biogenesis protein CcmH
MHKLLILLLFFVFCAARPAAAAEAQPVSDDPALEQRVLQLSNELRCLVCQNQTIADSQAELAVDLRNQVRDQLRQGKSEAEILDYMVERYGDFVRYRPPVKIQTLVLWVGPFVLLAGGMFGLLRYLRRRRQMPDHDVVSQQRLDEAARLLTDKKDGR